jgi:hypothetical protein
LAVQLFWFEIYQEFHLAGLDKAIIDLMYNFGKRE